MYKIQKMQLLEMALICIVGLAKGGGVIATCTLLRISPWTTDLYNMLFWFKVYNFGMFWMLYVCKIIALAQR